MNFSKISDRLGDWNPQLLREFKGRFTSNSLTFILITSAIIQVLFGLWLVNGSLGEARFVLGFYFLNWFLPSATIFGASYSLIADLNRERKSGTLDFIKSSPQSGKSIIFGKLLGVPSLVYLAILSVVPLHLGLALSQGASLGLMLLWYLTVGTIGYFCLVLTCLYALYGGKFAILYALLISQPISAVLALYNLYLGCAIFNPLWLLKEAPSLTWFYLPVGTNIWLFYIFTCCTLLSIASWLWIAIDRKYIDLTNSVLGKKDSYLIDLSFQLWLVGFALPLMNSTTSQENFYTLSIFQTVSTAGIIWMIPTVIPSRSSLQSWMHSWQQRYSDRQQFNWHASELIGELIWDDRSPAVLAMAINLAVATLIWTTLAICALILSPDIDLFGKFVMGAIVATLLTLIYTVTTHLRSLRSRPNANHAVIVIFLTSLLPIIFGLTFAGWSPDVHYPNVNYILLMFSPLFWMGMSKLSYSIIILTAIAQLGILMGAIEVLKHRLLKLGELKMSDRIRRQLIPDRASS
jgi:hypothetical protein